MTGKEISFPNGDTEVHYERAEKIRREPQRNLKLAGFAPKVM